MARATMAALIADLRAKVNGDATFTDDDLERLLDAHAMSVDIRLEPRPPFYREHRAPVAPWEEGALVYIGYAEELELGTDYTIDLLRGIVTTPAAEHRSIFIQGTAYDLNAAAADGWERIAGRHVGEFDFSANEASHRRSQTHEQALRQAETFRGRAWARTSTVDRADQTGRGSRGDELLDGFRRATDR